MPSRRGGSHHLSKEHAQHHPQPPETHTLHVSHGPDPGDVRRTQRPYRQHVPGTLKVLLTTLLVLGVVLVVAGQDEKHRRTAEAAAEITGVELQTSVHPAIAAATLIRYRFTASGTYYAGIALRSWGLTTIREAKVCYEPARPDNQILVVASATCP